MKLPFSVTSRITTILCVATVFLTFSILQNTARAQSWETNYTAALEKAKASNKDLLIVFTATDWVQICELFDRDILRQTDFMERATQKYELVHLEFPKDNFSQPAFLRNQNRLLRNAYRVSAFPIVLMTDAEGRPYGMTGYQAVTAAQFGEKVNLMQQTRKLRDDAFAKAEQASGQEKAKLLAQGIPELPGNLTARFYRPQAKALIEADPQNQTGRASSLKRMIADVDYSEKMQELSKDFHWSEMLELTDKYIADNNLQGAQRQQAMFNKIGVLQSQGKTVEALATLLQITKIDPETPHGKRAQSMLDRVRADKLTNGN